MLVFFGALLLRAPAVWVLHGVSGRLPVEMAWSRVSGTVSEANVYGLWVTFPGQRWIYFEKATLRASFLSLLAGRLKLHWHIDENDRQITGVTRLGLKTWQLSEASGKLPLSSLSPGLPELDLARLDGQVALQAEAISAAYGALPFEGKLEVLLEDLRSPWLKTNQPLGNYRMELQADRQSGITGYLKTTSETALLFMDGQFKQDPASRNLHFSGQARLSPNAPAALQRILPMLGRVNHGRVDINRQLISP